MSCTETAKWLNDYLDGELAEETRRSVEEHLGTCLSCHRALTELRSLLERAHRLPTEIEPEEALWPGIVSRITTPAVPAAALAALAEIAETGEIAEGSHRDLSRWFLHKSPLAAAAVLLLAVAVPLTLWQLGRDSVQSPPVAHAERQPDRQIDRQTNHQPGQMAASRQRTAVLARSEDGVLLPRTDLLEIIERQRDILLPETLATIEENALLIDQAIAQIRTALNESPGDRQLELLLAARYQQEVALLKRVSRV